MPILFSRRRVRRGIALLAGAGIIVGSVVTGAAAQAAEADIPSTNGTSVGQLHLEPSSGSWDTVFTRVWTDTKFDSTITPSTHRFVWLTVSKGPQQAVVTNLNDNNLYVGPLYGPYDFGSAPAATGGDIIGSKLGEVVDNVPNINKNEVGATFAVALFAKSDAGNVSKNDPYFRADVEVTATGWKLVSGGPVKDATTTTLVSSDVTQTSAKLTATVAPAAATGTVQFKNGGTDVGAPVDVRNGTAEITATGLAAGTTHTITALYSGDATHEASTGSTTVTTQAAPSHDSSQTDVGVVVGPAQPSGPGVLKITVKPESLSLSSSETRRQGQAWLVSANLSDITVDDDRRVSGAVPWNLNGRVSNLTAGENTIEATSFGWTPNLVSGAGSTKGDAVVAGQNGGLSTDKKLASGVASATNVKTVVNGKIELSVPADKAEGNYKGTLTLTLI